MAKAKTVAFVALMAALANVMSLPPLAIPLPLGPFTSSIHFFQLAIFLCGILAGPWAGLLGGAVGGLYMSLTRIPFVAGGIAILGGSFTPEEGSANQVLSAFGIGALAGYGSNKVFRWLDGHVNRIFSTQKEVAVPDLTGLTEDEAVTALEETGLKVGKKVEERSDPANAGKVILQAPKADSKLAPGAVVDITIATP